MLSDLPGIVQGVCESWGWSSDLQFFTGHQTHLSGTIQCLDSVPPRKYQLPDPADSSELDASGLHCLSQRIGECRCGQTFFKKLLGV